MEYITRYVYIDELFFINLAADYFLLLAAAKLCGIFVKRRRLVLGALIGAAYATAAAMPRAAWLRFPAFWVLIAAFMLIASCGFGKRLARLGIVFIAVSAAFAGALYAIGLAGGGYILANINLTLLCATFAVSYIVITIVFAKIARSGVKYESLKIGLSGKTVTLRALIDTGNSLVDGVTGFPVAICNKDDLTSLELENIETRTIRYDTIGTTGETLEVFLPDYTEVGKNRADLVIAVTDKPFADNLSYRAIVPAMPWRSP